MDNMCNIVLESLVTWVRWLRWGLCYSSASPGIEFHQTGRADKQVLGRRSYRDHDVVGLLASHEIAAVSPVSVRRKFHTAENIM